jgi:hypothetical protein
MEINTYSQSSYYQTQTTSKAKNTTNNGDTPKFESILIDSSNSTPNPKAVAYSEKTEFERYPYYPDNPEAKLLSFNRHKFFEAQAKLPWEEQLTHPNLQLGFDTAFDEHIEGIKEVNLMDYKWIVELRSATNGNKYDGAPEFKAFVDKWMATGLSEDEALLRAGSYATAGLLDYGSQRATMYSGMPLTDTKQHGLWLIDNEPLKKAILETLDGLSTREASDLVIAIFLGYPENGNSAEQTSFQELLTKYGVKLEDLKQKDPQFAQENPEVFSGDINLKNDNSPESQAYNNFIFKTIVGFFKDRIESLDRWQEQDVNTDFSSTKNSINLLIENFQEKVDEDNENITNGKSIGKK